MKLLGHIKNRLIRLRHRKGHGVHSPYIYNIVREVFMARRSDTMQDSELFDTLSAIGVAKREARELQNLYTHCGYKSFAIDSQEQADMTICSAKYPIDESLKLIERAKDSGATVVVLRKNNDKARGEHNSEIVAQHSSTTVDKHAYLLIFNNHLPKQHFIL